MVLTALGFNSQWIFLLTILQPSPGVISPKRKTYPDGLPNIQRPSITPAEWYRNINLLSIDYAFRPRLRIRLTLGGRTLPEETLGLR